MENIETVEPLTEDDIRPYKSGTPVVRLYLSTSLTERRWYAGTLADISLEKGNDNSHVCSVTTRRRVRYGHAEPVNPHDPGKSLITVKDKIIANSLVEHGEPIVLDNAGKLETDRCPDGMLVIRSSNGTAIVSVRAEDVFAVSALIRSAEKAGNGK